MRSRGTPLVMEASWGSRTFKYDLERQPRRDLAITVHPDGRVQVRAPEHKPLVEVIRRVHARRSWISRQLQAFEANTPVLPHRFAAAETMLYLGRQYRLKIVRGGSGVSLQAGRLVVHVTPSGTIRAVRSAVLIWYRDRARAVLERRAAEVRRRLPALAGADFRLRVRRMKKRWGSCTARGTVTLNPELLQAPTACVDYVLLHELVHLLEPRHSRRFYRLMSKAMPDWEARRKRLAMVPVRGWVSCR